MSERERKGERKESPEKGGEDRVARGADRSTSDSKEAPALRATPQCSNSIDYCCWCTFLPALTYDKRAPIPAARRPSHLPGRIDQPQQDFSLKNRCYLISFQIVPLFYFYINTKNIYRDTKEIVII